jgi:hypothetical protein
MYEALKVHGMAMLLVVAVAYRLSSLWGLYMCALAVGRGCCVKSGWGRRRVYEY